LKEKHLYRFGEFSLCVEEHALSRDGKNISITPKMFDLLLVFVQHPGRVLGKEFLLQSVWPDSFVEEGNISFNIRQLRKALDDNAQDSSYIETVPRRGYRFVAGVEEIVEGELVVAESDSDPVTRDSNEGLHRTRSYLFPTIVSSAVLLGVVAAGAWFLRTRMTDAAPILSTPFTSEKLSTTGMVFGAAISPDGKRVVYSSRTGAKQGVWLRHLDSGNNVPIIPASDDHYFVFLFAPDGNSIYFSRAQQGLEAQINIYRVSMHGGIPELIASRTEGWIGLSPDGEKISFVRCPRSEQEWCSLWMADSKDGANERKLVSRPQPIRIADSQISPDGKTVAFAAGQSRNAANDFQLFEVSIETGLERELTAERFFNIKSMAWLPDGRSILLTASRIQNKHFRIWRVSAENGAAEPLTKDSEAYNLVSLDKEAKLLVATQVKQDFRLNIFSLDALSKKTFLADAARATFASDGKIYYASAMSGNDEIWSIDGDGTGQRQLTNDPAGDGAPVPSPDGKTIYFASNRSGNAQIWRMNSDGSNQVQVTRGDGGAPMFVSPDNKLLYYKHSLAGTLWSVSLENGEERLVLDKPRHLFAFSPDGVTVAFEEKIGNGLSLTVYSLAAGRALRSFELPTKLPRLVEFSWMPDGKSLIYLMAGVDYDKNTLYRQSIDGGAPQEIGSLGDDEVSEVSGLSVSPDGKSFSVVQGGWKHDAVLLRGLK
jgi:Tol biopolymer transport system component/DNA-binding winged helix-turn-helix (wHTH) protein